MAFFYPPIDEPTVKKLEVIRQLMADHPGYFLEAPYSGETERMLKSWFGSSKKSLPSAGDISIQDDTDPWKMLYQETQTIFRNLKDVKFDAVGETSEKMAYFRTATSLLDKLVSLQERALGLKEIGEFQKAVLEAMESALNPDQRTKVMLQLKEILDTDKKDD